MLETNEQNAKQEPISNLENLKLKKLKKKFKKNFKKKLKRNFKKNKKKT